MVDHLDIPAKPSARRAGIVVNTTLDAEAVALLRHYCPPGRRATGRFLGRLLFEHDARVQEKRRVQNALHSALEGGTTTGK